MSGDSKLGAMAPPSVQVESSGGGNVDSNDFIAEILTNFSPNRAAAIAANPDIMAFLMSGCESVQIEDKTDSRRCSFGLSPNEDLTVTSRGSLEKKYSPGDDESDLYKPRLRRSRRIKKRQSIELYRSSILSLEELDQESNDLIMEVEGENNNTCAKTNLNTSSNEGDLAPSQLVDTYSAKGCKHATLEDIYTNKLWKQQMPKSRAYETIFEVPKSKNNYQTRRCLKRCFSFDNVECPYSKTKKRRMKALKLGWKPMTKTTEKKIAKLVDSKLDELQSAEDTSSL